jgi:hypothetical protein
MRKHSESRWIIPGIEPRSPSPLMTRTGPALAAPGIVGTGRAALRRLRRSVSGSFQGIPQENRIAEISFSSPMDRFWREAGIRCKHHERVTNGTMARSSARRSIKEKGRRALRRRPCLATAGSRVRFRCFAFRSCWIDLIGSAERRLTPLHAGMVRPYRGRLPLRDWNGAGYPLV